MEFSLNLLGREIRNRPWSIIQYLGTIRCASEVCEHGVWRIIAPDKNVIWLYVAVAYLMLVEKRNGFKQLHEECRSSFGRHF